MRRWLYTSFASNRWIAWLAASLVSTGCGRNTLTGESNATARHPGGFSDELAREVEALQDLLTFPQVLFFPTLLGLALVFTFVIGWATRLGLRLGVRRSRLLIGFSVLGRIGLWLWAISLIMGRLLETAPAVTLIFLLLVTIVMLAGLSRAVENVVAGVVLAMRGRITEGDQVRVGDLTGMVVRVGLTQVQLRNEAGDTIEVPARQFVAESVSVGRARHSYPTRVRLVHDAPWTAEEIERARRTAEVSPYRDPNTPVRVRAEGEEGQILSVEILVWSSRLVQEAEQHLRRQLASHLGEQPRRR